jgi:hypothetical protein
MTTTFSPLTTLPAPAGYQSGDVLFLCGELFGRGYANGIVDEARAAGMTIIGATVGRRDGDGTLRPLTAGELAEAEANLGGRIINIPLEAGFDMEPGNDGASPVDRLKGAKPDDWANVPFGDDEIAAWRAKGAARFKGNLAQVVAELEKLIPTGANVLFVHTMAGGIPRARFFMPLLNRVFKGTGDKYLSSEQFWGSAVGKLCSTSFDEVTADTFRHLLDATAPLRERISADGGLASYTAYGYHGCEVLIDGEYRWQSYTPYLQGWAKMRLEAIAAEAWERGIKATVFNCPEIQTNSSALFLGVEISLYPLLTALEREGGGPVADEIRNKCTVLLKDGETLDMLLQQANAYLASPLLAGFGDLAAWPHHNSKEQAELMLDCSARLLGMNSDPKQVVCAELSQAVFRGVGRLMFDSSWQPQAPALWLGHGIIARRLVTGKD